MVSLFGIATSRVKILNITIRLRAGGFREVIIDEGKARRITYHKESVASIQRSNIEYNVPVTLYFGLVVCSVEQNNWTRLQLNKGKPAGIILPFVWGKFLIVYVIIWIKLLGYLCFLVCNYRWIRPGKCFAGWKFCEEKRLVFLTKCAA